MYDAQTGEKHPQVEGRSTRTFKDQHGRLWQAVIENKTGHPVHPPSPKFTAPVFPPENYVQMAEGDAGELVIDYLRWNTDLIIAGQAFEQRRFDIAHSEYKDNPGEALRNPSPFLLKAIGDAPLHPNVPRACLANNQWILGFTTVKPKWALEYFPEKKEVAFEPDATEFPDEDGSSDSDSGAWPRSKGGGVWELSDKTKVRGEAAARAAQDAIDEFAALTAAENQNQLTPAGT